MSSPFREPTESESACNALIERDRQIFENTCSDCGCIIPCRMYEHREGCSIASGELTP
jgi:hypothetical protein